MTTPNLGDSAHRDLPDRRGCCWRGRRPASTGLVPSTHNTGCDSLQPATCSDAHCSWRARLCALLREETTMAVVNVIELLAESEEGWEDAVRQAVAEATKTLRGISSVYVKEFQATVENDKVKNFRVNVKVSFVLEESR